MLAILSAAESAAVAAYAEDAYKADVRTVKE
jgi:hypothetical protein